MTNLRFISLILLSIVVSKTIAQDTTTTDFFHQIKTYDLSTIIAADSIFIEDREDGNEMLRRSEILGFIGEDYQRFYIHFISVIQNPANHHEYLVYGKTKVKESICSFQGTITVREARVYKNADIEGYTEGFATCEVILFEDHKQASAGCIKGKLKSEFLIDSNGHFRYDALMFVADGFSNNEFVGTWTSYKTNVSKKCHWGDYRIPECGDLDIGVGEFRADDKYLKNGCENDADMSIHSAKNNSASKHDRQMDQKEWWE